MRTVGVMRICDAFAEHVELTIAPFSATCDGVCFLAHNVTRPEVLAAIHRCQNLLGIQVWKAENWHHQRMMCGAYAYAQTFNPDWIVMPDHDEILPYENLSGILDEADRRRSSCVGFPFLNCWESPVSIVDPHVNTFGDHVKAYRGNIQDFTDDPVGFCVPRGHWGSTYWNRWPLRHMSMLSAVVRSRRLRERGGVESWAKAPPKTYPYNPDWTIEDWLRNCKRESG